MTLTMFMCLEIFLVLSLFEDNVFLRNCSDIMFSFTSMIWTPKTYYLDLKIIFPVRQYKIDCCTEKPRRIHPLWMNQTLFHTHTSLDLLGKNWPQRFLFNTNQSMQMQKCTELSLPETKTELQKKLDITVWQMTALDLKSILPHQFVSEVIGRKHWTRKKQEKESETGINVCVIKVNLRVVNARKVLLCNLYKI